MDTKQRIKGEPFRKGTSRYHVLVQVVEINTVGDLNEWIDASEPATIADYATIPEALRHAQSLAEQLRLINECDRCSGMGTLSSTGYDGGVITLCPDCKGKGENP